ncbi:MAG: DUF3606 domain-containing protein [Myxococcales bacterium]
MSQLVQRGPRDRYRINLNDEDDIRYWTYALGVSRESLQEAVDAVGVIVSDVRVFLGKRETRS